MKILKFGGTSVGSPERMHHVARLFNDGKRKIVVLSAVSGTTNALVSINEAYNNNETAKAHFLIDGLMAMYKEFVQKLLSTNEYLEKANSFLDGTFGLLKSLSQTAFGIRESKIVLAQGEIISTNLMQWYLEESNIPSVLLPALDYMRIEEGVPVMPSIAEKLDLMLATNPGHHLFITQGYICRNEKGEIDNLKRGGSDYSASLIGAAVEADEIQIWTDIDGMHNNDPRIVAKTFPVHEISFDEAAELAYFGAKILHPSSVLPAQQHNIPVRLLNTMKPEAKGTLITSSTTLKKIKAIAAKDGITAIKIKSTRMLLAYGFLKRIFEVFERYKTPIDMITTSEVAVSLTIDEQTHLAEITEELKVFGHVEVDHDQTIICVVGQLVQYNSGLVARVFEALESFPIRMISFGGSKNNISMLIPTEYKVEALNALNQGLFHEEFANLD